MINKACVNENSFSRPVGNEQQVTQNVKQLNEQQRLNHMEVNVRSNTLLTHHCEKGTVTEDLLTSSTALQSKDNFVRESLNKKSIAFKRKGMKRRKCVRRYHRIVSRKKTTNIKTNKLTVNSDEPLKQITDSTNVVFCKKVGIYAKKGFNVLSEIVHKVSTFLIKIVNSQFFSLFMMELFKLMAFISDVTSEVAKKIAKCIAESTKKLLRLLAQIWESVKSEIILLESLVLENLQKIKSSVKKIFISLLPSIHIKINSAMTLIKEHIWSIVGILNVTMLLGQTIFALRKDANV